MTNKLISYLKDFTDYKSDHNGLWNLIVYGILANFVCIYFGINFSIRHFDLLFFQNVEPTLAGQLALKGYWIYYVILGFFVVSILGITEVVVSIFRKSNQSLVLKVSIASISFVIANLSTLFISNRMIYSLILMPPDLFPVMKFVLSSISLVFLWIFLIMLMYLPIFLAKYSIEYIRYQILFIFSIVTEKSMYAAFISLGKTWVVLFWIIFITVFPSSDMSNNFLNFIKKNIQNYLLYTDFYPNRTCKNIDFSTRINFLNLEAEKVLVYDGQTFKKMSCTHK